MSDQEINNLARAIKQAEAANVRQGHISGSEESARIASLDVSATEIERYAKKFVTWAKGNFPAQRLGIRQHGWLLAVASSEGGSSNSQMVDTYLYVTDKGDLLPRGGGLVVKKLPNGRPNLRPFTVDMVKSQIARYVAATNRPW